MNPNPPTVAHETLTPEQRAELVAKRAELLRSVATIERDLKEGEWLLLKLRVKRETLTRKIERMERKFKDVQPLREELEQAAQHAITVAEFMAKGREIVTRSRESLALLDAALR